MSRPTASRRGRSRDPRLFIGLGLVVTSVTGVMLLLAAADTRAVVVAARGTLTAGDRVTSDELLERSVGLAESAELYLSADDLPRDGLVLLRTVGEGELIPRSAVGDAAALEQTSIVVETAGRLSSDARAGAVVELWASPSGQGDETFGAPTVLVGDATVVRLLQADGLISGIASAAVELLVPRAQVARILQAQAAGDALAVVAAGRALPVG